MSEGLPIPKVTVLAESGMVSSSPDWHSSGTPGSLKRGVELKGSWQGVYMVFSRSSSFLRVREGEKGKRRTYQTASTPILMECGFLSLNQCILIHSCKCIMCGHVYDSRMSSLLLSRPHLHIPPPLFPLSLPFYSLLIMLLLYPLHVHIIIYHSFSFA